MCTAHTHTHTYMHTHTHTHAHTHTHTTHTHTTHTHAHSHTTHLINEVGNNTLDFVKVHLSFPQGLQGALKCLQWELMGPQEKIPDGARRGEIREWPPSFCGTSSEVKHMKNVFTVIVSRSEGVTPGTLPSR